MIGELGTLDGDAVLGLGQIDRAAYIANGLWFLSKPLEDDHGARLGDRIGAIRRRSLATPA